MKTVAAKKKELESLLNSVSEEQLGKIIFVLEFVSNASPDELDGFVKQLRSEDFNAHEWVESKQANHHLQGRCAQ